MIDVAAALREVEAALEEGAFDDAERLAGALAEACAAAAASGARLDRATITAAREVLQRCVARAQIHRTEIATALADAATSRRAAAAYGR